MDGMGSILMLVFSQAFRQPAMIKPDGKSAWLLSNLAGDVATNLLPQRSQIGESMQVQDQLKNVQEIHASHGAFAAILADGSVVAGHSEKFGAALLTPIW